MSAATTVLMNSIRTDQQTFRTALQALANPGQIERLTGRPDMPALNGNRVTASLLMALLDHEVTLAIEPTPDAGDFAAFIFKRTRTPLVSVDRAAFIVADSETLNPQLPKELRTGSFDYPDDGATLIVQVPTLDQAAATDLTVSFEGPGVPGRRVIKVTGLTPAFFEARAQANIHYPIGIDIYLIDPEGRLVGLPRTTEVTVVSGVNA